MIDQVITIAKDIGILFGISAVVGLVISPIVFLMTFIYDWLHGRYKNMPPIVILLFCSIIGVFIGLLLIYAYIKITVKVPIESLG